MTICKECGVPFCDGSEGNTSKKCWVWREPRVSRTLRDTNSYIGATQQNRVLAPINSRLNEVVRSLTPFGLGRNGCWPYRRFQLPRALPSNYFFAGLPFKRQKDSTQLFLNRSSVFSLLLLFSWPSSSPHSSSSLDKH